MHIIMLLCVFAKYQYVLWCIKPSSQYDASARHVSDRLGFYPCVTIALASSPGHSHFFNDARRIEKGEVAWGRGYYSATSDASDFACLMHVFSANNFAFLYSKEHNSP